MDTNLVIVILVGILGFISMLGIIHAMAKSKEREQTRREVAAYVAEGSMTPEQGERLLASGNEHPWKFLWDNHSDSEQSRAQVDQA